MQVSGYYNIFLFGCAGGACLELLRWWKLRESREYPHYAGKVIYWILTIAMILVGGFIAAVYGEGPTSAIQVMNIGAAAPAIIGALIAEPRATNDGQTRRLDGTTPVGGRIRRFLSFGG
jgi:hypothetical protein